MFSGAEIPYGISVTFFSILKKTPNLQKKDFFLEDWDFHLVTTQTSYMMTIYYH